MSQCKNGDHFEFPVYVKEYSVKLGEVYYSQLMVPACPKCGVVLE